MQGRSPIILHLKKALQDGFVLETALPVSAVLTIPLLPPLLHQHLDISISTIISTTISISIASANINIGTSISVNIYWNLSVPAVQGVETWRGVEPPEVEVVPSVLGQRVIVELLSDLNLCKIMISLSGDLGCPDVHTYLGFKVPQPG